MRTPARIQLEWIMAEHDHLQDLKRIAKAVARSRRVALVAAQNLVAQELGFPHWYALANKARTQWQPTNEDVAAAEALLGLAAPRYPDEGLVGGHPYRLDVVLDDVFMSGRGWRISLAEVPASEPNLEVTDRRIRNNPLDDPDFVTSAVRIAAWKADQVRASIARDWPRRSTRPDAQGRVRHPIKGGLAAVWSCLHCDGDIAGSALASNLWHCPECGASPIDVFDVPFWREPDDGRTATAPCARRGDTVRRRTRSGTR